MSRYVADKRCRYCQGPIESRGPKRDTTVIFCSRSCYRSDERERNQSAGTAPITKPCEECGESFTFYSSVRPNGRYCSLKCKNKAHSKRMTGRRQHTYTRVSTFRKGVRYFFYDRCSLCGWDEAPCDVAHILSRKDGGSDELDNVTMLCPNHHRMYDCGLISMDQVVSARQNVLRTDVTGEAGTLLPPLPGGEFVI